MAGKIRVRLYNILLGDAILVTLPGKPKQHILIDVGNKPGGIGADKSLFEPIIKNIIKELAGAPLDLYVMSHEHMDHVQGMLYASEKLGIDIKKTLAPKYVWLTASAAPNYYDEHEDAKKQKSLALAAYDHALRFFAGEPPPFMATLLALNDPRTTDDCVDYLRKLSAKTYYVHRQTKQLAAKHALKDATISIWAPEEDTSIYYGRFDPAALAMGEKFAAAAGSSPDDILPPRGVDTGAFYNLVRSRANGIAGNLLEIDKAANNTSVVFCLQANGKKLLFPGDAEERSWQEMDKRGLLEPVDFLKIAHHLSHNGTPSEELVDKLLPNDGKKRQAAVSTCEHAYSGIPDGPTKKLIQKRATLFDTMTDSKPGEWGDVMV